LKRLAPLALVAVLAFAGCSAGNQSADATPTATATPSATASESPSLAPALDSESPTATKTVDPSQAWADDMINLMLNGNNKSSFKDFSTEATNHYITSWSQPKPGVLAIEVENKKWSNCDLDSLGMNVMDTVGWHHLDLVQVIVSSEDGKFVRKSLTNEQNKNRKSAIPESCA